MNIQKVIQDLMAAETQAWDSDYAAGYCDGRKAAFRQILYRVKA